MSESVQLSVLRATVWMLPDLRPSCLEGKGLLLLGLLALLPVVGCVHLASHSPSGHAQSPLFSRTNELEVARAQSLPCRERALEIHRHYKLWRVELSSTNATRPKGIILDYYQLSQGKSPVVVLLPISGGKYEAESHFARYFAKHGFAVALVHRREVGKETPAPAAIEAWLKENVAAHRRVLDWIETRQELDAQRIGVFGISMGGIQAALLSALDGRIRAATLGLAGGDLPFILAHSTEKGIARRREAFLSDHQMTLSQFQAELREAITYDPGALAPFVEPDRFLLVLGVFDTVVPFRKGWELRQKLGRPETLLLPTGHYTALLCIPYVQRQCLRFFRRHLR
jgi:pimeloyl-ACP methyl ester carboxylesterase